MATSLCPRDLVRHFVTAAAVVSLVGCLSLETRSLRNKSANDLSCQASELTCRGDLNENGSRWVIGCGRFAKYVNTSEGWILRDFGQGPPPLAALRPCIF